MYGSQATRRKVYCGKITNWFAKLGVAEILVESAPLRKGDEILIIGPSTGVLRTCVSEIRVDLKPVDEAGKGLYCSIPVPGLGKLRRSDKVYLWLDAEDQR